jgi:hypothetical protein
VIYEPHPAADVWPMLDEIEMASLAESIADVGLLEPIVLTPDGLLLDGRNRARACEIVSVEPTTVVYDGDPIAFVLARNDQRRHMTKGQRAMAAVLTIGVNDLPVDDQFAAELDVSKPMVLWARNVAVYAPDLGPLVVSGARPLKDAYDEARERRNERDTEQSRLERLPGDLAAQVREGDLTLTEAEAAHRQRRQDREDRIQRNVGYLTQISEAWQLALTVPLMADFDDAFDALPERHRVHVLTVISHVQEESP